MAVIAILLGSVIGLFAGVVGWAAFGMTLLSAVGLYLTVGLGFAGCAIMARSLHPHAMLSEAKA
ncbi:hypothetical protein [Aestuariicoccus sp. MJ-SS9]|uniref:hypothetical protein n=1 Tax=Aestuariicoccus sp. MJ-SS9 TaxID=3079855 RepID=UPI00290A0B33|nr:hypothetical protein [Aestuariicoccus sp. MJ-SS9]MDU8909942.1 hypothetical protein [Aestuariicoccus sp. MJ-SS9]